MQEEKINKLGPIMRPLFKNVKSLFKELIQSEVVLSFRKGPAGKPEELNSILWDKAFGCKVSAEGITEDGLFLLMQKDGGIILSGKLLVLPQSNIEELLKRDKIDDESILDAQKEIFNMMVGKLNDILMEKVNKKMHLIMGENFIVNSGDPSFFSSDKEYLSYVANVKIAGPVSFSLAIVMSEELADAILKDLGVEIEEEEMEEMEKEVTVKEEEEEEKKEEEERPVIKIPEVKREKGEFHVEDIMEEDFPVVQIGTTVWDAFLKMKEYNKDFIILVDGLKFIGLLTMADIRRGLSPFIEEPFKEYCREQDVITKSFKVEWFLEKDVKPVPYESSLEEVLQIYLNQDSPYLPVCKGSRIMGVITHKKLIQFLTELLFDMLRNKLIADSSSKISSDEARAQA